MLETLLQNEFLVMALDALLHLASIVVLAVTVLLACKLLSRGHVDAKLFVGLMIAMLMVFMRVFLLNNVGRVLPNVNGAILEVVVVLSLFFTCSILVYKLVSIPALGTMLSSATIVCAQLLLANYIPQLSLKLMPEGQRFAEYAGLANDRTKSLMNDAKAFRGQSGGIKRILADAVEAIKFFTSDSEQDQLSQDFASGIALYKARKEYMDNMTPEELASYRKAMSEFLAEQGLAENRYSLSNLKDAKPEDLQNLAMFMKEMNQVYGFTEDLPRDGSSNYEASPPSAESLAQMAQSLSKVQLRGADMAKLGSLFKDLGIDADSVMADMAQAHDELADIRDVTGRMVGEFKQLAPGERPALPVRDDRVQSDDVIVSGDYRIKKIQQATENDTPLLGNGSVRATEPEMVNDQVSYFMPRAVMVIPEDGMEDSVTEPEPEPEVELEANYFESEALSPMTTEQSVVMIPNDASEATLWRAVSTTIKIDAWFAASGESGYSTIFIEGNAFKEGDILERIHEGQTYRFVFKGIEQGLITLLALERVDNEKSLKSKKY